MSVLKGISYNPDILNTSNIFYRNAFDKWNVFVKLNII
jgi:hypothetical protein